MATISSNEQRNAAAGDHYPGLQRGRQYRADTARACARRQNAKFWELRAATSLARLWRDQGKHTAARGLLSPCYEWFTEGLETPVLRDGKELLDQLA